MTYPKKVANLEPMGFFDNRSITLEWQVSSLLQHRRDKRLSEVDVKSSKARLSGPHSHMRVREEQRAPMNGRKGPLS